MDCLCCGLPLCDCGDCHNERCDNYIESFGDCDTVEEDYDDFGEGA